jgi:hypothetical protein
MGQSLTTGGASTFLYHRSNQRSRNVRTELTQTRCEKSRGGNRMRARFPPPAPNVRKPTHPGSQFLLHSLRFISNVKALWARHTIPHPEKTSRNVAHYSQGADTTRGAAGPLVVFRLESRQSVERGFSGAQPAGPAGRQRVESARLWFCPAGVASPPLPPRSNFPQPGPCGNLRGFSCPLAVRPRGGHAWTPSARGGRGGVA